MVSKAKTSRKLARHAALPGQTSTSSSNPVIGGERGRRRAPVQKNTLGLLWEATPKAPAQRVAAVAVAGVLVAGISTTVPTQAASNVAAPAPEKASVVTADSAANLSFVRVAATSTPSPAKPSTPTPTTSSASSGVQALNDPTAAQAFAASQLGSYGWSQDQMSCLVSLWNRESNWRTTAENPSSLAYGIAQSLPAEKMATVGADYRTNYKTQVTWGLGYIKERYGSPCGAWGQSQAVGWY